MMLKLLRGRKAICAATALSVCISLQAKVTLPSFISDNMVLQQQTEVKLWGWTDSGKAVKVTTGWDGKSVSASPDKSGKWMVSVPTPEASLTPWEISFSDGESLSIKNVLIGEVWFCSGQSNMDMVVRGYSGQPTEGGVDAILAANPARPIRICTIKKNYSTEPVETSEGSWQENDPQTVAKTSATAYFFADCLQSALGIPVGILITCRGGSTIETWIDRETIEKGFADEFDLSYLDRPWDPAGKIKGADHRLPCMLYNGQVHPLEPFTFKGMIWYQGEANRTRPEQYLRLMQAYAAMMREKFQNPGAPYYFVQIAPYIYSSDGDNTFISGYMYEAQQKAAETIPNSAMACTVDVGAANVIHPPKKREVGRRLAMLALARDYGVNVIDPYSPTFQKVEFADGKALVTFKMGTMGLSPMNVDLEGFEVSGADKVFHPAKARVGKDRKTIRVWSDEVSEPVAVRYCWRDYAEGTVYNNYGIPVAPFRTDDWTLDEVK